MKVGIPVSFMDAHVLTQVVVSTEFLTTRGHRAFVWFFIGMDGSDVTLQVFPPSEALATARDDA